MRTPSLRFCGLALLLSLASAACKSTAQAPQEGLVWLNSRGLEQVAPADVVVAPVRNQTSVPDLPLEQLRLKLSAGLVARLYSPIDLEYYDKRAGEAAFSPAELGAQAVLQVTLTKWDDSNLSSSSYVLVTGEAVLLDAANPDAVPLWGLNLTRRIPVGTSSVRLLDLAGLQTRALDGFAAQLLEQLPARTPSTAR